MNLPTLYKQSSKGKTLEWTIGYDGPNITTRWGEQGGKIQSTTDTVKEGTNIGRSNERNPVQQAEFQARAQWEKKLKSGWNKTQAGAESGKVDSAIKGGVWPMLAHKFRDHADKIVYPAFIQPKLDGHRCIALIDQKGKCTLWSRKRQQIKSQPHIVKAIEALGLTDVGLDGELYNHDKHDQFEDMTSAIKREEPKPGVEDIIQYHIYDLVAITKTCTERQTFLQSLVASPAWGLPLVMVPTSRVDSEDEATAVFTDFRAQKYEGAMIRNAASLYESVSATHRCYGLQKIKEMDDAEFVITGVKEGKGKLQGHAIFLCETDKQVGFEAKMAGPIAELRKFWDNPALAIGRQITVQYQGYTKYGKPRFPVALRFREDV